MVDEIIACIACGYRARKMTNDDILESEKQIKEEVDGEMQDIDDYERKGKMISERMLDRGVMPFFPLSIDIGVKMNPNYVSFRFKDKSTMFACACPRCGTVKISLGFDPLEVQHAHKRAKEYNDFYRQHDFYYDPW